ncbi:unnamed protein product [Parnassius apollo]|uniref:(apollo) hypothetical protein n=1 Tax=Parnassius apollo TaxID=110799 RepID=A0A8S3W5C6_PARAO|nr:unnamed protein product [Parnassius apollo]
MQPIVIISYILNSYTRAITSYILRTFFLIRNVKGSSGYSFGYGISDAQTGDVKTVWKSKKGETVQGHYSLLEPDGSVGTVEYSAGPGKEFTAAVDNKGAEPESSVTAQQQMEDKSYRDYKTPYEYSEDAALGFYSSNEKRNKKRPYDSFYKEYSMLKKPTYSTDAEFNGFPNLPSIKHPRDETGFDSDSHSYFGFYHDPNCKNKHTQQTDFYKALEDMNFGKPKYPFLHPDSYGYDKYSDSSNNDEEYFQRYKLKGHKSSRPSEMALYTSITNKYSQPTLSDITVSENFYPDEIMQRPKKRSRPHKHKETYYSSDDLSDYVLVPKRKLKRPQKVSDINDYPPEIDEDDYDNSDEDEDRNHKPPRGTGQKEVVKKIIKKKKPSIINLLDILDI